jgi:hypothetical protein
LNEFFSEEISVMYVDVEISPFLDVNEAVTL